MELRQLRYFIKAAELSNFTEAANALYISQSTLSQQIRQLEDELDTPLFDRIAKRVRLTEAGSLFLPAALRTIQESEQGKNVLADLKDLRTGTLNIGLTYGITSLLLQALVGFTEQYPQVKINIEYGTSEMLLEKCSQGRLDFVLSFNPVQDNGIHTAYPLFTSVLSLVVVKDHPLAEKASIGLPQLATIPLVLPVNKYSIRTYLDDILARDQVTLDVRMEINDINILLNWVCTGKWGTILMQSSLFNHPSLTAIPIAGSEMERTATITWSANAYRKRSAIALSNLLKKT